MENIYKNRIIDENIKLSKLRSIIYSNAQLKECFFLDKISGCSKEIVSAHSLQKLGSLSIIEDDVNGNKKVYALTEKEYDPDTGLMTLKPVGKKSASTFFGVCKHHDQSIFQPIEQNPEKIDLESDEHCFLLSLKAFAISYHSKKQEVSLLSKKDPELREKIKLWFNHGNLESHLSGARMAVEDMNPQKNLLLEALIKNDYSVLDYFTIEFDFTTPIAMCMLTTPPFLFSGKAINTSSDPNFQYSGILTSVIPLRTKTLVVFAAFPEQPFGSQYLDEIQMMYNLPQEKALTWHILTSAENCFFSPKWYKNLTPKQKHQIVELSSNAADLNTDFLRFDQKNFALNFFDRRFAI